MGLLPLISDRLGSLPWEEDASLWAGFQGVVKVLCPHLLPWPKYSEAGPSFGREGALAASLEWWQSWEDRPLPPSLPSLLCLLLPFPCSSLLSLQGDVELTGHLPWARDGSDAMRELAC